MINELREEAGQPGVGNYLPYISIINLLSVCLILTDSWGNIVYCNSAAEAFLSGIKNADLRVQWSPTQRAAYNSVRDFFIDFKNKLLESDSREVSALFIKNGCELFFASGIKLNNAGRKLDTQASYLLAIEVSNNTSSTAIHLASIFGLTRAEQRIVETFSKCHEVKAIAKSFEVRENTIRMQLKSIYEKLGVSGQSDLLAIINRHPASLITNFHGSNRNRR